MIINYNQYLSLIKEGLIRTHNIEKYEYLLKSELDYLQLPHDIKIINKFQFILLLKNTHIAYNNALLEMLKYVNNLGYYPSKIKVNNEISNIFDMKYLSNKYKEIEIIFEAKYEDGLYKNNLEIPKKAYHLTKQIYKDKIENNGLYPKRKNRKGNHLERIYLFYDIKNYKSLLETLKFNDILYKKHKDDNIKNNDNGKYMLLEVKLTDENIIHTDPNYIDGFYTTDNISVNHIKIIEENL